MVSVNGERPVRIARRDREAFPPVPWFLRWATWDGRLGGWLEFRADGMWFRPYRYLQRLLGVKPNRLVGWDDVVAIDLAPTQWLPTPLGAYGRDRRFQLIGFVRGRQCEASLRRRGFEPHRQPAWPDHRLWTCPPEQPDWTLLHDRD
jgi:hypothetical protein